jgi:hypothetical protein
MYKQETSGNGACNSTPGHDNTKSAERNDPEAPNISHLCCDPGFEQRLHCPDRACHVQDRQVACVRQAGWAALHSAFRIHLD